MLYGRFHAHRSNITGREYDNVVAGSTGVDTITTNLRVTNENRDAATGATLQISMPSQFGFFEGSTNTGVSLPLDRVTTHTHTMYMKIQKACTMSCNILHSQAYIHKL